MVAFPANAPIPSVGTRLQKDFRFLSADFGDGYTQRTGDGLNTEIESWSLVWDNITAAEATILYEFFDARQGYESIDYTMPNESTEKKWIVKSYTRTPESAAYAKVEATFTRVYDL